MLFLSSIDHRGVYRKPSAMMWTHFVQYMNSGVKIDMSESFYCGDAAGRPAARDRAKDFSDSDLKFA